MKAKRSFPNDIVANIRDGNILKIFFASDLA